MITQCSVQELYDQEKEFKAAVELAKTFERRRCNHRQPLPGDECFSSVVGERTLLTCLICISLVSRIRFAGETNKHRYVVATQSQELRQKLRAIPAVPIVHMNRSVMILEPPSDATLRAKALVRDQSSLPTRTR